MLTAEILEATAFTDHQVKRLNAHSILFGHQSVGDNILDGIERLVASDPRFTLKVESLDAAQATPGPGLIETRIGKNRHPETKNAAFEAVLEQRIGRQVGIAMMKYCYIDFNSKTDVRKVFRSYRKLMTDLKAKYPSLVLVHVTVPLTTEQLGTTLKERTRTVLRRMLGRNENVKRNAFNALLRRTYGDKEPIFDLAELESTRADGSRSYFRHGATRIYTLAPEWTTDGGHLNQAARRTAAERLLLLLANL